MGLFERWDPESASRQAENSAHSFDKKSGFSPSGLDGEIRSCRPGRKIA